MSTIFQQWNTFLDQFLNFLDTYALIATILSLVLGILLCFIGYKVSEFFVGIISFALVGSVGVSVAMNYSDSLVIQLLAFVGAGTLGALICIKVIKLGLFIMSSFVVFTIMMHSLNMEGFELIIAGVISVIVGIFTVVISKQFLIAISSFAGAYLIVLNIGTFAELRMVYTILLLFALTAIGVLVQFVSDRNNKKVVGIEKKRRKFGKDGKKNNTSKLEEDIEAMRLDGDEIIESASSTIKVKQEVESESKEENSTL